MNINPIYVTFEQARLLAKLNFQVPTRYGYTKDGSLEKPYYGETYMNTDNENTVIYSAPEQWQVVEWLRVNHNIFIEVYPNWDNRVIEYYDATIYYKKIHNIFCAKSTPQESYSAAFDYILNNELI